MSVQRETAMGLVRLRHVMVAAVFTAASTSGTATAVGAVLPHEHATVSPLRPMSRADLRNAEVLGTGCFWSTTASGPTLLAMVEDRAAIRTADGIVTLSPAAGARDMFPFTHDRWRSADGRIAVAVRQTKGARMTGEETLTSSNLVEVAVTAGRTTLRGVMQCGS